MSRLRNQILDDLYRMKGTRSIRTAIKIFFLNPGFRYITIFRLCKKFKTTKITSICLYHPFRFYLYLVGVRFGIQIPVSTNIGRGFYIGHHGNIIVSSESIIGDNCNISQGVTIGRTSRGKRQGAPTIGNNVYLGPACIISGNIKIGDNAVIGAGAIVNFDVEENSVVASPRATKISDEGSHGYVNRCV